MKIKIPLNWTIGKKKTNLSMNNYRNMHYQVSSKLKRTVSDYLLRYDLPKYNKISVHYTVFFKDKRKRDLMNFVSVVDKFVLDHFVKVGSLKDDNYNYVSNYSIEFGGLAKENYIEMQITELRTKPHCGNCKEHK